MGNDLIIPGNNHSVQRQIFHNEVMAGLSGHPKRLPSKYFYDEAGDKIFQQIMASPEYYLTRCEMEIFIKKANEITSVIAGSDGAIDVIELGAGDGSKTIHLLKHLLSEGRKIKYIPIDISGHILDELTKKLNRLLPDLEVKPLEGEYLEMLSKAKIMSNHKKVLMFSGANIGNMNPDEALQFCIKLRHSLLAGDHAIIGFDLKKNPHVIKAAYDDQQGLTRAFNLNLLARINKQLAADFDLNAFTHYCAYDPETGSCKSYLVSMYDQVISFPDAEINFKKGEYIHTEVSQKYSLQKISAMALSSGFSSNVYIQDSKGWFVSAIWKA